MNALTCLFCGGHDDVRGVTCAICGRDPKVAANALLTRIETMADGGSLAWNYQRAIKKIREEAQ